MIKVLRVLMLLAWVAVLPVPAEAGDRPSVFAGKRAIFDEGIGWTTRAGADRTLARIKDAGFQIYVPCVWHGRGVSWPSVLAPWDTYLAGRPKDGYDPLRYLIAKAHEIGIEVHPWFTVALRQADLRSEFAEPGTPEHAFDVHNPQFRRWMADLVAEVVARYPVDGINLDYVRAMGLCASTSCEADYQARYGRTLALDRVVFNLKPGRMPSIIEWQEQAVSTLVEGISNAVRAQRHDVVISADVAPDVLAPAQGQNSLDWANRGLVDVLFRMDYARAIDVPRTESLRSRLARPDVLTLLIANNERVAYRKGRSRDEAWLIDTIGMIERRWPRAGVGVYLYSMLTDAHVAALKATSLPAVESP